MLPLVLAAAIYPPLSGMLARMLRFLVVLLVFPAIAELVLLVGAAVLGGAASLSGGVAAGPATLVAGAMIYILAADVAVGDAQARGPRGRCKRWRDRQSWAQRR